MKPYYKHGDITIYHGDCREILPELDPVDLVLTDPPYGTTACKWDSVIDLEFMWRELDRLSKDMTPLVLFSSQPFTTVLVGSNLNGFKGDIDAIECSCRFDPVDHLQLQAGSCPHIKHFRVLLKWKRFGYLLVQTCLPAAFGHQLL